MVTTYHLCKLIYIFVKVELNSWARYPQNHLQSSAGMAVIVKTMGGTGRSRVKSKFVTASASLIASFSVICNFRSQGLVLSVLA